MTADSLSERDLETAIELFLARNFPQIDMHGGSAGIEGIDRETGEVWITLGGACAGCGISPLTVSALQSRLVAEFDEIDRVHTSTDGGFGDHDRPDLSDVPF
ncbi:NifU family protein [Salinirubrum litoreum]|uniref:NifU family protein n=1 Tax=Salinirubrum litoreum TaxID=1126234 RepID=A0ABD5R9Q7_9EURY|nr:NifU family protein [Salinirubrum litoreum]